MTLQKVQSGQPMRIKAQTFNSILDATRAYRERQQSGGRVPQREIRDNNIVLVQNTSGDDVDRFGVLGIGEILFSPTDNLEGFKSQPVLKCVSPAAGTHEGRFVVTLGPIKSTGIGDALLTGVTPVQINVTNEDHTSADIADAQSSYLESADNGSVQILWKESGTGTLWALVRLPVGGSSLPTPETKYKVLAVCDDGNGGLEWKEDWARGHG